MGRLTKEDILNEIRRTAKENGGVPLGKRRFEKETGIKPYDWGKYWARFGDAQREAGFEPNTLITAYDIEFLLEKFVGLARELGRFPTSGELLVKSNSDPDFPHAHTIQRRLGNKKEAATKILEYAEQKGYRDVAGMCKATIEKLQEEKRKKNPALAKLLARFILRSQVGITRLEKRVIPCGVAVNFESNCQRSYS